MISAKLSSEFTVMI